MYDAVLGMKQGSLYESRNEQSCKVCCVQNLLCELLVVRGFTVL